MTRYADGRGDASHAVDGISSGEFGDLSCTHTNDNDPEWWQVDLGAPYEVYNVRLFHRTDCCQDRLVGAHVHVSTSADYTAAGAKPCYDSSGGAVPQPEIGSCGGVVGQFITVSTHGSGAFLTLCEVEAYGVPATSTNVALNKPATQVGKQ